MNREEIEVRLTELLVKRLRNELSDAEWRELEDYCTRSASIKRFADQWLDENYITQRLHRKSLIDTEAAWKIFEVRTGVVPVTGVRRFMRNRWVMAASLIGLIAVAAFFLLNTGEKKPAGKTVAQIPDNEIMPAKSNVVLTLGNGKIISLHQEGKEQLIASQGNNELISRNNELVYTPTGDNPASGALINELSTGYTSVYRLKLADGTKVWLNAQSVLRYPAGFSGNERRVELSGEGYFEVAPETERPFYVVTPDAEIKVLGTRFDVNAYDAAVENASSTTTLFEGAVKIESGGAVKTLRPGEQATVGMNKKIVLAKAADEEHLLAWVSEKYSFRDATIEEIIKELRRHYEIDEVVYKGKIDAKFNGSIGRGLPLSEVLRIFSSTGYVQFIIHDKNIIVKP